MAARTLKPELDVAGTFGGHDPAEHHQLDARDLHVHYGKICALHKVSFRARCGHCVGLLGPNGAGKSTLLKAVAGLGLEMGGSILWRGRPLNLCRKEIAYLPQVDEVDPNFPLSVRGLVGMGRFPHLGNFRRWTGHDEEIVDRAVALLDLGDLQHRRLDQLSGGQRQRANLARALAQEAHVLLLDEPFTGLDAPNKQMLSGVLRALAESGHLVMASHHDLRTVPDLFDEVLMLRGELIASGPTGEVFQDEAIAATFGDAMEVGDV